MSNTINDLMNMKFSRYMLIAASALVLACTTSCNGTPEGKGDATIGFASESYVYKETAGLVKLPVQFTGEPKTYPITFDIVATVISSDDDVETLLHFTLKEGDYLIDYSENSEEILQFPANFSLASRDIVLWNADWFNIFGGAALPSNLIGLVDYKNKTVTFDGSWIYNGEVYQYICYGLDTYFWDQAQTQIMVFWGSGDSGQEPIVMTFDDEGYITSTTAFEYSIYENSTGKYVGLAARTSDGSKVTYSPLEEEGNAKPFNAMSEGFVRTDLSSGRFVK